jgi:hypothetical protein
MRINNGTRAKKSKSTSVKKASGTSAAFGTRAVMVTGICFIGAAIIIGASSSSRPAAVARLDAPSDYAPEMAKKTSGSRAQAADAETAGTSGRDSMETVPAVEPPMTIPPTAPPVTITGCLEREEDSFRLKDTSGAGAPKSRSWKSGFLKKGSASIDVVNPPKKLRLSDHVGERVSLTGVMVDRDMQVRSLQRVAGACN